jgi:hypothetical protein
VLARALETAGIATVAVSMVREHSEKVKPPRTLFVPFPFGHAMGRAGEPGLQHRVLHALLNLLHAPSGPVIHDFPDDADRGDQPPAPTQASAVVPAERVTGDVFSELAQMQQYHEQWLAQSGGRTALGLSGLGAARLRDAVRFLDAFARGQDVDMPERPRDLPLPSFIRYCVDDVKALYVEAHLAMKPIAGGDEVVRWLWAETALGQILRRVRDRLDASDDPRWKAAAFGVAR